MEVNGFQVMNVVVVLMHLCYDGLFNFPTRSIMLYLCEIEFNFGIVGTVKNFSDDYLIVF